MRRRNFRSHVEVAFPTYTRLSVVGMQHTVSQLDLLERVPLVLRAQKKTTCQLQLRISIGQYRDRFKLRLNCLSQEHREAGG